MTKYGMEGLHKMRSGLLIVCGRPIANSGPASCGFLELATCLLPVDSPS